MAELCWLIYERVKPELEQPQYIPCTFIKGHSARHSWETLRLVDEQDADGSHRDIVEAVESGNLPQNVKRIVAGLGSGMFDAYLELILAAGHDRKRARRGTLGFPRRDR